MWPLSTAFSLVEQGQYCCITNYSKMKWQKSTIVLLCSWILRAGNLDTVEAACIVSTPQYLGTHVGKLERLGVTWTTGDGIIRHLGNDVRKAGLSRNCPLEFLHRPLHGLFFPSWQPQSSSWVPTVVAQNSEHGLLWPVTQKANSISSHILWVKAVTVPLSWKGRALGPHPM